MMYELGNISTLSQRIFIFKSARNENRTVLFSGLRTDYVAVKLGLTFDVVCLLLPQNAGKLTCACRGGVAAAGAARSYEIPRRVLRHYKTSQEQLIVGQRSETNRESRFDRWCGGT